MSSSWPLSKTIIVLTLSTVAAVPLAVVAIALEGKVGRIEKIFILMTILLSFAAATRTRQRRRVVQVSIIIVVVAVLKTVVVIARIVLDLLLNSGGGRHLHTVNVLFVQTMIAIFATAAIALSAVMNAALVSFLHQSFVLFKVAAATTGVAAIFIRMSMSTPVTTNRSTLLPQGAGIVVRLRSSDGVILRRIRLFIKLLFFISGPRGSAHSRPTRHIVIKVIVSTRGLLMSGAVAASPFAAVACLLALRVVLQTDVVDRRTAPMAVLSAKRPTVSAVAAIAAANLVAAAIAAVAGGPLTG
jgi:hypothetical protein